MVFRLAASAVEVLVQRSAVAVAEVGDDEAGVGAVAAGLDAGDDAADPAPGLGGVEEFLEAADLASGRRGLEARRGAFLEAGDMPPERAIGGAAEHVVEAVRLAPVHDVRAGVMAVGAKEDLHLWPVGPDRADEAAQKRPDLDALRPLGRAQEGGDVVAVLVAGGDHQQPEADDVGDRMHGATGMARIVDASSETVGDFEPLLDLAQ